MARPHTTKSKLPLVSPTAAKDSLRNLQVVFPPIKIWNVDGSVTVRPGKAVVLAGEDWLTTSEAGKILGVTSDWVGRLCDQGKLEEGRDWRRISPRSNYKIRRASVLKLRPELVTP